MKWRKPNRSHPLREQVGFNDFYDALRMFCSNDTLGLGIGNIERNYLLFGIPTLRF